MIFNEIDSQVKSMRLLRNQVELKANSNEQNTIDLSYDRLIRDVNTLLSLVVNLGDLLEFTLTDEIKVKINDLLINLDDVIKDHLAEREAVKKCRNTFESVKKDVKTYWERFYNFKTETIISTLKVIKNIDSFHIKESLEKINAAKAFDLDVSTYQSLKKELDDSKKYIDEMNLNDEIKSFLIKMNSGEATLNDITGSIKCWLNDERLEKRIKISFK